MGTLQAIVDDVMAGVTAHLEKCGAACLHSPDSENLIDLMRDTLHSSLASVLKKGELHQRVNDDMRQGLQDIYHTINSAAGPDGNYEPRTQTGKLFSAAAEQLDQVMNATFEATETIMNEVETLQDKLRLAAGQLQNIKQGHGIAEAERLLQGIGNFEESLSRIMTSLSFQDLTGQRLKKVVAALGDIQEATLELYLTSSLMLKLGSETPDKDIHEIKAESRRRLDQLRDQTGSQLQGPSNGACQKDVDQLLADLGL